MGATLVRLKGEDGLRLNRLRDAWERVSGQRPTLAALMGHALAFAETNGVDFLAPVAWADDGKDGARPLTAEEIRAAVAAES